MLIQLAFALVSICVSGSYAEVINKSPQKELLDYEAKVSTILRLLKSDCDVSTNLSDLMTDDIDLLKFRYLRLVTQLQECLKDKAKQTSTVEVKCPGGYKLNPFSSTCIRLIQTNKTWEDAKNYCEASDEYLATFETVESANWFIHQRKSDPVWRKSPGIWFGGRKTGNGPWKWHGKSTGTIKIVLWDSNEPCCPDSQDCMGSWLGGSYTGRTHDAPCSWAVHFVCEKVI